MLDQWGTLKWKQQESVPLGVGRAHWANLPKYPSETKIGTVYRLDFCDSGAPASYIGYGVPGLHSRLKAHLSSSKDTQVALQRHLMAEPMVVWTLDPTSTIHLGDTIFTATYESIFELELFEKAAIAYAKARLEPRRAILNKLARRSVKS